MRGRKAKSPFEKLCTEIENKIFDTKLAMIKRLEVDGGELDVAQIAYMSGYTAALLQLSAAADSISRFPSGEPTTEIPKTIEEWREYFKIK